MGRVAVVVVVSTLSRVGRRGGNERRVEVEHYGIGGIAQARPKTCRQSANGAGVEGAGHPAGGCQNRVAAHDITAWREDAPHSASKRGGTAHVGGRGRR